MGRTFRNYRDEEESSYSKRGKRNLKHSRNVPGEGMRILNGLDDLDDEFDDDLDDEHYANTSQYYDTRRK